MKVRAFVVTAVTALSSLALFAPAAQAGGQACYSVSVIVNGEAVVDQAGCQDLP